MPTCRSRVEEGRQALEQSGGVVRLQESADFRGLGSVVDGDQPGAWVVALQPLERERVAGLAVLLVDDGKHGGACTPGGPDGIDGGAAEQVGRNQKVLAVALVTGGTVQDYRRFVVL